MFVRNMIFIFDLFDQCMSILHQNSAGDVLRTGSRSKVREEQDGKDLHCHLQVGKAASGGSAGKDGNRHQGNLMQGVEKPKKKGQKLGESFDYK